MATAPSSGSFAQFITETEQVASFASAASGYVGTAFAAYGVLAQLGIVPKLVQSDTDKVLAAIDELKRIVDGDFVKLSSLLQQQVQLIIDDLRVTQLASNLRDAGTASDKLARYLRKGQSVDLDEADTHSDDAIQYFLALPSGAPPTPSSPPETVMSRTDPFFLPGIVKAGSLRIWVLTTRDPDFRTLPEAIVQITNIIGLLDGVINRVKAEVNIAHTVQADVSMFHSTPPKPLYNGYYHQERARINSTTWGARRFEYFSVTGAGDQTNPNDSRVLYARQQAESARQRGIAAELSFLGIPEFTRLLDEWKKLVVQPMQQLPGVATSDAQAITLNAATGNIYLAWKGMGNDPGIYWSATKNQVSVDNAHSISWKPQQRVSNAGTSTVPALACFRNTINLAWKGAGTDSAISWSQCSDDATWTPQQVVPLARTSSAPALVATNSALYLLWKGDGGSNEIFWAKSIDGKTWVQPNAAVQSPRVGSGSAGPGTNVPLIVPSGPERINGIGSSDTPAVGAIGDVVYMAWKGAGSDPTIWWSQCSDGKTWAPQKQVPQVWTSHGPALAVSAQGVIVLVWKGDTGTSVWYTSLKDPRTNNWQPQSQIGGIATSTRPALAPVSLMLSWKKQNTEEIWVGSLFQIGN